MFLYQKNFHHLKNYSFFTLSLFLLLLADEKLLETISVSFIHASAKDDYLRLWVMRPRCGGRILSFERLEKCKIPMDQDRKGMRDVIEFFWLVKNVALESQKAILSLKDSNDDAVFDPKSKTFLPDLLKPCPIKPTKMNSCGGIVELDPISFIE
ncbi:uncharacterized protein BX664DRAFT_344407 [Halteromyces radiatus]|uniref:uncharacterized protein n=1 Tax=Halteromyces radiatus TaxID=101107 RepID=UPI0022211BFA|nr:uncharacterized protein BX664DRAFT_344407 [Halteromyces radiatus]KAI8076334.1 hypothetical protein BX664DRAFT_344407 [Halteromyces radiatus]